MLKFIHIELLKLRRRKCLILTLAASPIMPFLSMLYFKYIGKPNVEPVLFYKWSVFGFTCWMILPFILGILSSLLFYTESSNHINTYFWAKLGRNVAQSRRLQLRCDLRFGRISRSSVFRSGAVKGRIDNNETIYIFVMSRDC